MRWWADEPRPPRAATLLALIAPLCLAAAPAAALAPARSAGDSAARAQGFERWAREILADSSLEARQRAIRLLEQAIRLAPRDPDPWLTLGQAYELGSYGR